MDDRRKHQRYLLNKSCFLANAGSVGTIVDICMGGLSCMCLEDDKCGMDFPPEKGIDIFCEKATLVAQGVPVKVVDSIVSPGEFGKELKFRKCHVKFNQLENDQHNNIKEIILGAVQDNGNYSV